MREDRRRLSVYEIVPGTDLVGSTWLFIFDMVPQLIFSKHVNACTCTVKLVCDMLKDKALLR